MAQLTIQLSSKAEALIAQLQKQIFNRRRKKVSASGVVETLLESGAKSQSDKRFATSWRNLIDDIEKAAAITHQHGTKPAAISDQEWALILSHRSRAGSLPVVAEAAKPSTRTAAVARSKPKAGTTTSATEVSPAKASPAKAAPAKARAAKAQAAPTPAKGAKTPAKVAKVSKVAKAAAKPARPAVKAVASPKAKPPSPGTSAVKASATSTAKSTAKPKTKPTARAGSASSASSSLAKRMAKAVSRLSTATVVPASNGEAPQPVAAPLAPTA